MANAWSTGSLPKGETLFAGHQRSVPKDGRSHPVSLLALFLGVSLIGVAIVIWAILRAPEEPYP